MLVWRGGSIAGLVRHEWRFSEGKNNGLVIVLEMEYSVTVLRLEQVLEGSS